MSDVVGEEKHGMNHSILDTWIRVCPRCLGTQVDLHLHGIYSPQFYKCIECGYIGLDFIQVTLDTLKKMKAMNKQSQQENSKPKDDTR